MALLSYKKPHTNKGEITTEQEAAVLDLLTGQASFRQAGEVVGRSHQGMYQLIFSVLRVWVQEDSGQIDLHTKRENLEAKLSQ